MTLPSCILLPSLCGMPFTTLLFVNCLVVHVIGECWVPVRLLHAAAVSQRATCVSRVEQRGLVKIDFIEFSFSIFDKLTVVFSSRCPVQC